MRKPVAKTKKKRARTISLSDIELERLKMVARFIGARNTSDAVRKMVDATLKGIK